jgi:hypothetical protein
MARASEPETKKDSPPPSPILVFLVGLLLFSMILCPAAVLFSYNIRLNQILDIITLQSLTLGCFMGLVIAIIPALIFTRMAMKKAKKKKRE